MLKDGGIFFISSLCSKDNNDHHVIQNGKRYRFVSTCKNLQKEVEKEGLIIIDKTVYEYENREFNHINLFVKCNN